MDHVPYARLLLPGLLAMTLGACAPAGARCFAADTVLPTRAELLASPALGGSGRDLAEALLDRDAARARRLLDADPALARQPVGRDHDMLTVAIASCDPALVSLLLDHGAPPDGVRPGLPLDLALRADDPDLAFRLLGAGAHPNPKGHPTGPLRTAIELNSLGGVRMLLDFHADPNAAESNGRRPLHIALDTEHFRIAELLLDRGADPWAVDHGGANLGSAVTAPMVTGAPAEDAARQRLVARLARLRWPNPVPGFAAVRALAAEGHWPPHRR
jgi:hypothetical protein